MSAPPGYPKQNTIVKVVRHDRLPGVVLTVLQGSLIVDTSYGSKSLLTGDTISFPLSPDVEETI